MISKQRKFWRDPVRIVPLAFLAALAVGTAILMLPISRSGGGDAPFMTALFTATSALCVTGLSVVDTPTYWTFFGQVMILLIIQIGGLGVMTGATMIGIALGRHFGLEAKLTARVERGTFDLDDTRGLMAMMLLVIVALEGLVAVWLTLRWHFAYEIAWPEAIWHGVFHAVSAFNNAGFSTFSPNLVPFNNDFWILFPIMVAISFGALGFPVLNELRTRRRWHGGWSLHSKITLLGSMVLFFVGMGSTLWFEWNNPRTLGPMSLGGKLLNSAFQSVTLRTAGFNSFDIGGLRDESLAVDYALMFIGGGSAGTSGGIKVSTFVILGLLVLAVVQGRPDPTIYARRISRKVQRESVATTCIAFALVFTATLVLLGITDHSISRILFETISAFGTVGLTTGITPSLPAMGQLVLIILMFVGRVGTITMVAMFLSSNEHIRYRFPEEEPLVG